MDLTALRDQAKRRLEGMSPERLHVAADFLAYLEEREADEATAELLAFPGFQEALEEAEAEVQAGRLTPVEELQRKD